MKKISHTVHRIIVARLSKEHTLHVSFSKMGEDLTIVMFFEGETPVTARYIYLDHIEYYDLQNRGSQTHVPA